MFPNISGKSSEKWCSTCDPMVRYYFIICALPELVLGFRPEITFADFLRLLEMNLTSSDKKQIEDFLLYIDFKNIRALWMEQPMDPRGTMSDKELEEALLVGEGLPSYVNDFLDIYEGRKERLAHFSYIYTHFFRENISLHKGFFSEYFQWERELRWILTALRAKTFEKDISRELQFEDPTDPLIAHILAQKDMDRYEPPGEYEEVRKIFEEFKEDPKGLEFALLQYRFSKILDMEQQCSFAIGQILGYLARLILVKYWDELDETKGKEVMENLT